MGFRTEDIRSALYSYMKGRKKRLTKKRKDSIEAMLKNKRKRAQILRLPEIYCLLEIAINERWKREGDRRAT